MDGNAPKDAPAVDVMEPTSRVCLLVILCVGCLAWPTAAQAQRKLRHALREAKPAVHRAVSVGQSASDQAHRTVLQREAREAERVEAFEDYVEHLAAIEVQIGLRLYRNFDDYRAITALRRYQILSPEPAAQFLSELIIGQIYHRQDKPQLAALSFQNAAVNAPGDISRTWSYLLGLQELCLPLAYYFDCRKRLQQLAQVTLPEDIRGLIDYQMLYTDVVLRSPYVEPSRLEVFSDPELEDKARGLLERDEAFYALDLQKPWLAGTLSAIFPGAGQAYNGRWLDGGIALGMNALFGVGTWYAFDQVDSVPLGVVMAVFWTGFYAGNVVNAINDAQRTNAERYRRFFEQLKLDYWPRVSFRIEENQVDFGYQFDWPGPKPSDPIQPAFRPEVDTHKTSEEGERSDDGRAVETPRIPDPML